MVVYLITIECSNSHKKTEGNNGKQVKQNSKYNVKSLKKRGLKQGVKHASKNKTKNARRKKNTKTRRKKNELEKYDLTEIINEYIQQKRNKSSTSTTLQMHNRRQLSNPTTKRSHIVLGDLKPDHLSELQIPNPKFCEDRLLSSAHHFFIHPWWYDYCMRIKEKQEKRMGIEYMLLPVYRRVLDRVQKYKKMKQQQLSHQ